MIIEYRGEISILPPLCPNILFGLMSVHIFAMFPAVLGSPRHGLGAVHISGDTHQGSGGGGFMQLFILALIGEGGGHPNGGGVILYLKPYYFWWSISTPSHSSTHVVGKSSNMF